MDKDKIISVIIAVLALIVISIKVVQYNMENTIIATVISITEQQRIRGSEGSVSTSYMYLVSTDKGLMYISPSGIMASTVFGNLKEGGRYRLHTRGFAFHILGIYPHIVDATAIE